MTELDLRHLELLIGEPEPSVFKDYVDRVVNAGLMDYKREDYIQYGGKAGEPLYVHVLNGVCVLETLRALLDLTDTEAQVLYTAFTIHDINKVLSERTHFGRQAIPDNLDAEINRLGLDGFFPDYADYMEDITLLVRGHGGHSSFASESLIVKRKSAYRLGLNRVTALIELMRAADAVELSQTLEEKTHKDAFLSHLNAFVDGMQYTFVTHRLAEHRGLLTNVLHNAIVDELQEAFGLIPLLFYPEGVVYLARRGEHLALTDEHVVNMAKRAAGAVTAMTAEKLSDFVDSKPGGITIDPKCLELGLPFRDILRVVAGRAQTRNRDPDQLEQKARGRAQRDFAGNEGRFPDIADDVAASLDSNEPLVSRSESKLYLGELARAYYIFLKDHCGADDPWQAVYDLLDLPRKRWPFYEFFDARWDRAYVLADDIRLSEEAVAERLIEDGQARLAELAGEEDPNAVLLTEYLSRQVSFSFAQEQQREFTDHLAHYVTHQHKQCVHCSTVFETDRWMAADVRGGITVQAFSNRLRGGPGDPKKYVCAICKLQFLLEKLNFAAVSGENPVYLHLFPYSFLTAPFIQGLRTTIRRILEQDVTVRALLPNTEQAFRAGDVTQLRFASRTKEDRPYSYGLYLPRFSQTVGNLLIFPFNSPGANDSERFLFALWNAMLLQRHFGCKVLLSESPVVPLDKESFGDLFVDNAALSCRGLVTRGDYRYYWGKDNREAGPLKELWMQAGHLFAIKQAVFTTSTKRDEMLALVQAMAGGALQVFYTAEKLLEARVRGASGAGSTDWLTIRLSQRGFPHVEALAETKGGTRMSELSDHLKKLAGIAWSNQLRGRTLAKNSLMTPLDEVFKKMNHRSEAADLETLRAAAADDIFEYLTRITESQYRPGQKKWEACKAFVDTFFDDVFQGVYRGKRQKLLADEKLLRSAFLFYIREEIPRREEEAVTD